VKKYLILLMCAASVSVSFSAFAASQASTKTKATKTLIISISGSAVLQLKKWPHYEVGYVETYLDLGPGECKQSAATYTNGLTSAKTSKKDGLLYKASILNKTTGGKTCKYTFVAPWSAVHPITQFTCAGFSADAWVSIFVTGGGGGYLNCDF